MAPRNDKTVDIYVRVSRRGGREDEKFHSPEEQEQLARQYAKGRGLKVGIVLTPDIDRSGGTVEREGLKQALERVRSGESQGIVVAWIDRFSRDAAQAYDLLRSFDDAGGRVFAPEAPEDVSSPEGELQLGLFLLIAQYQRKRSRAGFQRAKERAILAGIPVGPVPFGYRQRDDRRLEPDPRDAPVVRELFERRARGDGPTALADLLTEHTGHVWTREGAISIIKRRLYATGRLEYGETVSDHEAGAIVDEPLWHAAQLRFPGARKARSTDSPWLLTGLAKCAACGLRLKPNSTTHRGPRSAPRTYRRYVCRNRSCTERANVVAGRLEKWATLHSFAVGDEVVTRATAPDLGALEQAVTTAERRLAQVLASEARDALGDMWAADAKARRTERDEALTALGVARQEAGVPSAEYRLRDVWADLDADDRREALRLFWKEIRVGRPTDDGLPVTFVARGPHGETEVALPTERSK